ncbi:hypothetical protein HII31_00406 [Pseudocercospora fuligena]|uniref:Uncharacterized protein n=1 Tax=Pseudocercospora fuligena TaxID=685502 RepID=A0A8H6VTC0_9PEZI|nr:hypothetical protein HII31_00406 [Pseudocercospora fuligena]
MNLISNDLNNNQHQHRDFYRHYSRINRPSFGTMPVVSRNADQNKTGFLDLAPELRNAIYDFALVRPDPIRFELAFNNKLGTIYRINRDQYGYFALNLLRSCAQVFHEGIKVFYGANTFRFIDPVQLNIFFRKQITWSAKYFCNIELCNANINIGTMVQGLKEVKNLKHLMMGTGWEKILDNRGEAPDTYTAATLRPLAERIYHNQETKNKQEVLATFCFGEYIGGEDGVFEETEDSAKLETAVGGRLYDVIPDGDMKIVKMHIGRRKFEAFWQVRKLMQQYPGIRRALNAQTQDASSATSALDEENEADDNLEDVEMADFETEDDDDSSGDEDSMIDDEESSSEESDDSDEMDD